MHTQRRTSIGRCLGTGVAVACFASTARAQADPAIAYVSLSGKDNQKLVVMNADGSNAAAILSPSVIGGSAIMDPAWSPTGTQIAFYLQGGASPTAGGLWRLDVGIVAGKPKGLNPTQLTTGSESGHGPAWSPAGDMIASYEWVSGPTQSLGRISVVPASGGTPTALYTSSHTLYVNSPTWSPDASRIAFLEKDPVLESFRIRVLDVPTGVTTTVLSGDFSAQFSNGGGGGYKGLDWARSGDVLAFSVGADAGGPHQQPDAAIYLLDLTGGPPVLALDRGVQPAWSPDDSSIVFRDVEDSNKLRRVELNTGVITTFNNKLARDPDWRRF